MPYFTIGKFTQLSVHAAQERICLDPSCAFSHEPKKWRICPMFHNPNTMERCPHMTAFLAAKVDEAREA
jgi:hypothetical protein